MIKAKNEFAVNSTDHRIVYRAGRPIGTIRKNEDGRYELLTLFSQYVMLFDTIAEAIKAGQEAPSTFPDKRPLKFGPRKTREQQTEDRQTA